MFEVPVAGSGSVIPVPIGSASEFPSSGLPLRFAGATKRGIVNRLNWNQSESELQQREPATGTPNVSNLEQ